MQDLILEETPDHTITITVAEQQAIIDANDPEDIIGIAEATQELIRSRQVDPSQPYYLSLEPFNLWRGDPNFVHE